MYRMLAAKNFASMRACENGFCIHLYAGLRLSSSTTRPEGIASGLEQCQEDSPAAPDGGWDRSREGSPARSAWELEDGLFLPERSYCGKSVKTLLDIGAEYTSIDQSLADELGVRMFRIHCGCPRIMKRNWEFSTPANRIHHLKNEICCVFPTVWRHGSGKRPPIRASHGSGRCWGFRR